MRDAQKVAGIEHLLDVKFQADTAYAVYPRLAKYARFQTRKALYLIHFRPDETRRISGANHAIFKAPR